MHICWAQQFGLGLYESEKCDEGPEICKLLEGRHCKSPLSLL